MSRLLVLNAGSSSVKFGLYTDDPVPAEVLRGQVDGLGATAKLVVAGETTPLGRTDAEHALPVVFGALGRHLHGHRVAAVGHRIVHGGPRFAAPVVLDRAMLDVLDGFSSLAPLHQPHNLAAVRAAMAAFPEAVQVGCFDTAFHRTQPPEAERFAIPRALHDEGVRRYGFHGLSYQHIAGVLAAEYPALHAGRVIVAHLGSGASMAALRGGRSVATTMGFSALDGLPMGTRPGQIDPGVLLWLIEEKGHDARSLTRFLYKDCGLLGVSGLSNDMRVLEASDAPEAAEAIALFAYRIRCEIGALAAALGGLDGLVFTGGIGEHSARVRAEALAGLGWQGLAVDPAANATNARQVGAGALPVLVLPTDEEGVIAAAAAAALTS